MIGKIKTLFKVFVVSIVMVLILFGIYRREYISQAIPVYMQYLEQKEKWEEINTGTYVYFDLAQRKYLFIKNNKLVKLMQYGLPWEPKHVKDLEHSYLYSRANKDRELPCFLEKKEYLIEKKFNAVKRLILLEKLLDTYASLTACSSSLSLFEIMHFMTKIFMNENRYDKYAYEIAYNNYYGYPISVSNNKIILGMKSPFRILYIEDLLIFPEETEYTDKVLKKVLDYYGSRDRYKSNHNSLPVPVLNIVGDNLIKSGIFDINETFEL
ncbi:MAG: hypothetical protein L3J43_09890 [Sulfurovum sp.]|nr:hypothetical protein [Sulfurovum sp.]